MAKTLKLNSPFRPRELSPIFDKQFLLALDREKEKTIYAKVQLLDDNEDLIQELEGRVTIGNLSSQKGTYNRSLSGNITLTVEATEEGYYEIQKLVALNRKFRLFIGLKNTVDKIHDDIIWFKMGLLVASGYNLTHSVQDLSLSLSFKDKICLLDGTQGGTIPADAEFKEYTQIAGYIETIHSGTIVYPDDPNDYTIYGFVQRGNRKNTVYKKWSPISGWEDAISAEIGEEIKVPQRYYDVIQTLVCNFGHEDISKIIINDVPLKRKEIVHNDGTVPIYYRHTDNNTHEFSLTGGDGWEEYPYGADCGYRYIDFVVAKELNASANGTVTSILDAIIQQLGGNYEYYYDADGAFVFQEVKNYLNSQYSPVVNLSEDGYLLSKDDYYVDFVGHTKEAYSFEENSSLVVNYTRTAEGYKIKNDFHIWGGKNKMWHYHLVIKNKPSINTYYVVPLRDKNNEYTGKVRLAYDSEIEHFVEVKGENMINVDISYVNYVFSEEGNVRNPDVIKYTPTDWRAELYLRGLQKKMLKQRPDVYEQELLDKFDIIYDMRKQEFKADIVENPNDLKYWIDFIEPINGLEEYSVDEIGSRIVVEVDEDINAIYAGTPHNIILIDETSTRKEEQIQECIDNGWDYAIISEEISKMLAPNMGSYGAQTAARLLIYNNINEASGISLTTLPIFYLELNTVISVSDRKSEIYGNYLINSLNIPLDAKGTMSIGASKLTERI